nr:uncharacterized protein LOC111426033 isoform X1 [Onthophagus taurus]
MMGVYGIVVLGVFGMMSSHVFGEYAVDTSIKKLCEDSEIILKEGSESSVLVSLDPNIIEGECKVKIKAPKTYVVHMTIVEIPSPPYLQFRKHFPVQPSCNMSVFQIDSIHKPVWNGDMCSNGLLRNVDLLNPEITLLWHQPTKISSTHNRKLLFTAVGLGDVCKRKDQHTCMSIGHKPLFCISDHLICDGYQNCPKGATKSDEDTHLCTNFNNINELQRFLKNDMFAENIFHSLRKPSEAPLFNIVPKNHDYDKSTTTAQPEEDKPTTALESISMTLSQYGPWGYILLGMLLCAAVLMFCGVIECLRKPKPVEPVQTTPTTVLIINNQQDDATPPRYEDLDPPSYNTLFPNAKEDDENSINIVDRRNSSVENDDTHEQSTSSSEQNDSNLRHNGETSFSLQDATQTESQT